MWPDLTRVIIVHTAHCFETRPRRIQQTLPNTDITWIKFTLELIIRSTLYWVMGLYEDAHILQIGYLFIDD